MADRLEEWDPVAAAAEDAELERQLAAWDAQQLAGLDHVAAAYDAGQALQRRRDRRVALVRENKVGIRMWDGVFPKKPAA